MDFVKHALKRIESKNRMNKKIIYIMMVISVFGIMMCGCGKKDVQTTANGGNSDVINEV